MTKDVKRACVRFVDQFLMALMLTLALVSSLGAQTVFNTIHSLNGTGGSYPMAGLISDAAGNLYGTSAGGGTHGGGVVFKLVKNSSGHWTESVLHNFGATGDGHQPVAGLVFDAVGNLYGTTISGGLDAAGTVFKLAPNT